MKPAPCLLPLIFLLSLAGCQHDQLAPAPGAAFAPPASSELRSPWDDAPVRLSAATYNCGPMVAIAPDLTVTTSQNNLSPQMRAAVYAESDLALHDLTSRTGHCGRFLSPYRQPDRRTMRRRPVGERRPRSCHGRLYG